jgi:hypothetical protein
MNIIEYYYNDNNGRLYIEFSTKEDGDKFYRTIELGFDDIEYYSPNIITKKEMEDIDNDFLIELLDQYFKENELPEEETL